LTTFTDQVLGPGAVSVRADSVARCVDTAAALGVNTSEVEVDQKLFDPLAAHICDQPDWDNTVATQAAELYGELQQARSKLAALQELLGRGVAPPLQEIPDVVSGGYFVGGLRVASEVITETFLLEEASSMPVAWGNLTAAGLRSLEVLHRTYFTTMYGGRDIAQRYASGTLAKVLEALSDPNPAVPLEVLVGHDTNLEGVKSLLGLEWQCGPWSEDALTPLAGLLFTLSDGGVHIRLVCPTFAEPPLAIGTARFRDGSSEMPVAAFRSLVTPAIAWQCVNSSKPAAPVPAFQV